MILYFHLASTGLGIFWKISDLTLGMIFKEGFNHQSVVMILKYILCLGSEVPGLRGIYSEHPSCKVVFVVVTSCPPTKKKPLVPIFKNGRWDVRLQGITNAKRITGWRNAAFASLTGFVPPS